MPNRTLRSGIITSEAVNALSPTAEVLYRRLMSVVDDWGRYDGRVQIIRPSCYPLQLDRVREADVQRGLAECEKAGLVRLYTSEGKPYVQMMKWDKPRALSSKWPHPPDDVKAHAYICSHMLPDTDTESDTNTEKNKDVCGEPTKIVASTADVSPPVEVFLEFPVTGVGKKSWCLDKRKIGEWTISFPGVNVESECRKAWQWVNDNPTKRKTANGMLKFLNGWLSRTQNSPVINGGTNGAFKVVK